MNWLFFINGGFLPKHVTGTQRYAAEITTGLLAQHNDVRILLPRPYEQPI